MNAGVPDSRSPVRRVGLAGHAHACFFRTAADGDRRKALVQITERCDLHCAHCFVSATQHGADLSLDNFRDLVLPRLRSCRVDRVTLTGGEPFAHPQLLSFCDEAVKVGLDVGICTNGTSVTDHDIAHLRNLERVHVNVSLDGARPESHGRFRGDPDSFAVTVNAVRRLAGAGLLQGILSTPNSLVEPEEFQELAELATTTGADYLLMNPLSAFGRGVLSRRRLAADAELMNRVRTSAERGAGPNLDVVPIRFPNEDLPLTPCVAGNIIYVFVGGDVAVCPYLVFAARGPRSRYSPDRFTIGNILTADISQALDDYKFHDQFAVGSNATCKSCGLHDKCGKGCPAAVIAAGGEIGDRDTEPCPVP